MLQKVHELFDAILQKECFIEKGFGEIPCPDDQEVMRLMFVNHSDIDYNSIPCCWYCWTYESCPNDVSANNLEAI